MNDGDRRVVRPVKVAAPGTVEHVRITRAPGYQPSEVISEADWVVLGRFLVPP